MLYILYGTDMKKAREKLNSLIGTLLARKKDAALVRVPLEEFDPNHLSEYAGIQGLFAERSIIVFDSLFLDPANKECIVENVEVLKRSENVFILLEGDIDAKTLAKLSKYAEKVQEFAAPARKERKPAFNIFSLSDALGERNKKKLWVLYQTGKMHNMSDEEMHGILFWGVKNMLLSKDASDPGSAGLSPFVFRKASAFSKNYTERELITLSRGLMELYHKARRGAGSFEVLFEQFILGLA